MYLPTLLFFVGLLPGAAVEPHVDMAYDQLGRLFFTIGDSSGHAVLYYLDATRQAHRLPLKTKAERIVFGHDPDGVLYGAETRDYRRWGEYEVLIWRVDRGDAAPVLETVWPTWRRLGPFEWFAVDREKRFFLSFGSVIMRGEPGKTMEVFAGDRGGGPLAAKAPATRDGKGKQARIGKVAGMSWDGKGSLHFLDGDRLRLLKADGGVRTLPWRIEDSPRGNLRDLTWDGKMGFFAFAGAEPRLMRWNPGESLPVSTPKGWRPAAVASRGKTLVVFERHIANPTQFRIVRVRGDKRTLLFSKR
ncbi:hypothetical protein SCOR_27565 [Sulfidibacter corallicola]|uniref:Uncharacterized protein n=1 Tax=Sulfidibacter corallicola TaxID=2818388 RepID=A0A8A4TVY3_SULCO|nr:hypothetical protein [Sulfidibacter corallicola]QTD50685.1 hypothetical protein J3U87_34295 [Sulfidibacter corallicola]